jgi:glycerophosphoryl diester phosphodiesterase
MAAFSAAVDRGADMVELDLQRCRDGTLVVLHDPTLSRLWGVDQAVAELDLDEVLAVGHGAMRIPSFRQVLGEIGLPLMVDFTEGDVVSGSLEEVRRADALGRCLFVSRNVAALRTLRSLSPEARIGLSWIQPEPPPPSLLQALSAEFWNPMFRLVTPERVAAVHDLGLQVSAWTVDEPRHMARVLGAGVDAIISNRIAELRAFLA